MPADLTSEHDRMVDRQIAGWGIAHRHVLDAMSACPASASWRQASRSLPMRTRRCRLMGPDNLPALPRGALFSYSGDLGQAFRTIRLLWLRATPFRLNLYSAHPNLIGFGG